MDEVIRMVGRIGSPSYSIGKLFVYERNSYRPSHKFVEDRDAELVKYENAYTLASKMIQTFQEIYDRLILQTGV